MAPARPAGALERERKWLVDDDYTLPAPAPGGAYTLDAPREAVLVATYYDAADLPLLRAGITLRRRRGEGEPRWTLKLPRGSGGTRLDRLEVDVAGDARVPVAFRVALRTLLDGRALRPVAHLRTRRRSYRVVDRRREEVAAILCDDRVVARGAPVRVAAFRELELELAGGRASLVHALARELEAVGARPAGAVAKLARALSPPPPAGPVNDGTVATSFAAALAALLAVEPAVRLDLDAEAVHEARVAVRRLRALAWAWRCVLDSAFAAALVGDLRWLGASLGTVRDADVLQAWLRQEADSLPAGDRDGARALAGAAGAERARAFAELAAGLDHGRYRRLVTALRRAAADPPVREGRHDRRDSEALLAAHVTKAWRRARACLDLADADASAAVLHKARISLRRVRYLVEAQAGDGRVVPPRLPHAVLRAQKTLGTLQDADHGEAWLRHHAGVDGTDAFVAGLLAARLRARADRARTRWPTLRRRLRRAARSRV